MLPSKPSDRRCVLPAVAAALTETAIMAKDGVAIRVLTENGKTTPQLRAAVTNWMTEYGSKRPLEVRIAPAKRLHDRAIFIDKSAVWLLSQSIKNFGERSPATVIPLDALLVPDKQAAYEAIWTASTPI